MGFASYKTQKLFKTYGTFTSVLSFHLKRGVWTDISCLMLITMFFRYIYIFCSFFVKIGDNYDFF